jgi:hypothetical protein
VLGFSTKDRKRKEAQGYLTRIINHNNPQMGALREGPRDEQRLNLTLVAFVVPVSGGKPDAAAAMATVTKEVSTSGLRLVLPKPVPVDEVVVIVRWEASVVHLWAEVRHQEPIGAGLWQAGVEVSEIVPGGEFPQLATLQF